MGVDHRFIGEIKSIHFEQWSYLEIVPKILVQEQRCLIEQAGKYVL